MSLRVILQVLAVSCPVIGFVLPEPGIYSPAEQLLLSNRHGAPSSSHLFEIKPTISYPVPNNSALVRPALGLLSKDNMSEFLKDYTKWPNRGVYAQLELC
jgi:hypothetical protein